jgi:hypothetical protein
MAKVTLPSWITGIKGRVGDVVFRVSQSGDTYVTRTPDMSAVEWSPAQAEHRQRFKAAIAYAKAAMADPDARAVYEKQAAVENRRPFQMAVSDYFKGNDLLSRK